jgi:hypothetical protein
MYGTDKTTTCRAGGFHNHLGSKESKITPLLFFFFSSSRGRRILGLIISSSTLNELAKYPRDHK